MKKYNTDYIVVEGIKADFEKEMKELNDKGYIPYGNMNTTPATRGGFRYSQLMSKIEPRID